MRSLKWFIAVAAILAVSFVGSVVFVRYKMYTNPFFIWGAWAGTQSLGTVLRIWIDSDSRESP